MADPEDCRVFVGGLSWDTTDETLGRAFCRFGKVLDAKIMVDRDTGRPRGFGFVTFADEQSMEDAIAGLHNRELDGRIISVTKAQPKLSGGKDYGYEDAYDNGGSRVGGHPRGGGGGDECFKCGKPGHWARECPSNNGGQFPRRFDSGRSDRYGGPPPRVGHYSGGNARDNFGSGRYGDGGYGRGGHASYDRGNDRYGSGGRARSDRGFRDRPVPYSRPIGRSAYNDRY